MSKVIELELYDIDREMLEQWVDKKDVREYFFEHLITNKMNREHVLFLGNKYSGRKLFDTVGYTYYSFAYRLVFTVMIDQYEDFIEKGKLYISGQEPTHNEKELIQYWFGKMFV